MRTVYEIRYDNIRQCMNDAGIKTIAELAQKYGKSQGYINNMLGNKPNKKIGEKVARGFEKFFNLSQGYLDKDWIAEGFEPVHIPGKDEIGNRVVTALKDKEETPDSLAASSGIKKTKIQEIISGPNFKTTNLELTKIANVLGVRLEWLLTGEEPMNPPVKVHAYEIDAYENLSEVSDDHTTIPLYDVNLSAGDGAAGYEFVETKYRLPFRIDWLQSENVKKENVKMMRVKGNSMYPILGDGDKVLIDVSDTTVQNNRVYALIVGDELFVKRLRKTYNGGLEIISENSDEFDKITIPPEDLGYVHIIGRVFNKQGKTGL